MIYFLRTKHHHLNKNNWSKLTWLGNLWDDPMIHALFPVNSLTEFESYACFSFFFNFFCHIFIFCFSYWLYNLFNIPSMIIYKKKNRDLESKRLNFIRSLVFLYFSPLRSYNGTSRIPVLKYDVIFWNEKRGFSRKKHQFSWRSRY
jgi:hypothetical protein